MQAGMQWGDQGRNVGLEYSVCGGGVNAGLGCNGGQGWNAVGARVEM